jgi:hypothetical protein
MIDEAGQAWERGGTSHAPRIVVHGSSPHRRQPASSHVYSYTSYSKLLLHILIHTCRIIEHMMQSRVHFLGCHVETLPTLSHSH